MPRERRCTTLLLALAALLVFTDVAHARQTPEQKCQKGRYDAAAKYLSCQRKLWGKYWSGGYSGHDDYYDKVMPAASKCRERYTNAWLQLQKKALGTGATCDRSRFEVRDDGTVMDWLTGLQWERKTDDASVHDKDNRYSWSGYADDDPTDEDGTAFTTFLAVLNDPPCFAGQCGWRLPTIDELQTVLHEPYSCTTSPCIDQAIFGPTASEGAWSASSHSPNYAWIVDFTTGRLVGHHKTAPVAVRAVRAGF